MGEGKLTELDIAMIKALLEEQQQALACNCSFTKEEVFMIKNFMETFKTIKSESVKILTFAVLFGVGFIIYLIYSMKKG
jgi:hypothetical protein